MEINDENLPKLVVIQSFSLLAGMTCNQFSSFLQQAEEQMAAIIFEVYTMICCIAVKNILTMKSYQSDLYLPAFCYIKL